MSKYYLVWEPSQGETVDDAKEIIATSSQDAAEQRAERDFGNGDSFTEAEYSVKRNDSDIVKTITVYVEYEPSFTGIEENPAP